jgi:hypothetical protein
MTDNVSKLPKVTERERIRQMRAVAVDAERSTAIELWLDRREAMAIARGGPLELPSRESDLEEIKATMRIHSLAVLGDIMLHSLSEENQIKAAQVIAAITIGQASQPLAATIPGVAQPGGKPAILARVVDEQGHLSPEKTHDMLKLRRKTQSGGGP